MFRIPVSSGRLHPALQFSRSRFTRLEARNRSRFHRRRGSEEGCLFVMVFLVGLILFWNAWKSWSPEVLPEIRGRLEQPLFGSPQLIITVWHQHPGNLHRGEIRVTLTSGLSIKANGVDAQVHSFETWEPNEDHQKSFVFPLRAMDPNQELPLEFSLKAKGIRPSTVHHS